MAKMRLDTLPYITSKTEIPLSVKQKHMTHAINTKNVNLLHTVIRKLGADVNLDMENGMRPIILAGWNYANEIINELLAYPHIDVNARLNWNGNTALHYVALHLNIEGVRMLLAHPGVDPNVRDANGNIPLSRTVKSLGVGHMATFRLLLERTSDVNSRNERGETPIWLAAEGGHADFIEILLQCPGIDPNLPTIFGKTPLHVAAVRGQGPAVAALLKSASINATARDRDGNTPWAVAKKACHYEVAEMIAEHPGLSE